ncbi:MAG: aminotransferase class V-fold PLP-dependent enzyme [Cyanobacteria bacterium M_surface_10_m1_298]|nr:aminotransferase class V-fold PLP-dependent enzyme [Cyanobacteria bacterium M_surface_10_m1_298]
MASSLQSYFDASATTPLAAEVETEISRVQAAAWANPSSLHGYGLAAAEMLERSRQRLATALGCSGRLCFSSGGTESIHLALFGAAAQLWQGSGAAPRLLISAVEHPATTAAAQRLQEQGWQLDRVPVDRQGLLDLDQLDRLLAAPTRMVSLIWGQSEVGALMPLARVAERCRQAGVLLHVDAVQVAGQQRIDFDALGVDLMSLAAHKLRGPRGVGLLLARPGLTLQPLFGGGGQEGGWRSGTESVALIAGFAAALERRHRLLTAAPQAMQQLRNRLLEQLLDCPGFRLSGPDPLSDPTARLPHHISLLVSSASGEPLHGRAMVQQLWKQGLAISSGSACRSLGDGRSAVLSAMGYDAAMAASGIRISLGDWHLPADLIGLPEALLAARAELSA